MKSSSLHKVALCVSCLLASSANAGVSNTFTDRTAWETAVGAGNFVTEAFSVAADQQLANSVLEDVGAFNVFYTTSGGMDSDKNFVLNNTAPKSGGRVDDYLQLEWDVSGDDSTETLELRFDTPISAFAANIVHVDSGDSLSLALDGSTVALYSALGGAGSTVDGFLGWTLDSPVSSISFTASGPDVFFLDNVSVSAIPLPAAVWLFGSALLGLVGVSRKGLNRR